MTPLVFSGDRREKVSIVLDTMAGLPCLQKVVCAGTLYSMETDKTQKIVIITEDKELARVLDFCFDGWGYEVFFESAFYSDISSIARISPDIIIVDAELGNRKGLEICDFLKTNLATVSVPVIALLEKKHLRRELLKLQQGVDDYLIKPPDPLELRVRVEMAIKRSQHNFYANPLTGLPGGILIEEAIRKKLEKKKEFVTGQVDIDNFKSFNDRYGYLQGDRVIMQTAHMLTSCLEKWGERSDFVGHIGGDDFVIISTPEKYNDVCENFICMFDTIIRFHYSPEDRAKGFIAAKDRADRMRKIPLMSVTVALVMKNSPDEVNTTIEINERIAEVKQYLKKIPGSKYMADRRILKKNDHLKVQVFQNDDAISKTYKPLGQILLEKGDIDREQLDKALKVHWKRGGFLGETLEENGMVTKENVTQALRSQYNDLENIVFENSDTLSEN
jgi:DNA-binding response OmpR family regulator